MLVDERNPRSARFQLAKLAKHVRLLPDAGLIDVLAEVERLLHDCRADVDADQGELFGGGERRLDDAADRLSAASPCASATRSRSATSATCTTCRGRRSACDGGRVSRRARDALRPRGRRVDVAARGLPDAADAAAPARAVARAGDRAGAGEPCAADRLLRQRRRPVHDSDALRRDARGRPERRRGDARREPPIDARRRRAVGSGPRRARLPARRAVRRTTVGVQLSVAVHRHRPRSWRRIARESFAAGSAAGRGGGRPDAPDPPRVHRSIPERRRSPRR